MRKHTKPKTPAELRLRNAVETMANIFYLLENSICSPDDIKTYLRAGRPALDIMIEQVQGKRNKKPDGKGELDGTDGLL
jgi:hypothetical protein